MAKVAIVGAGVVGLCCAIALAERGVAVVLIDKTSAEPFRATRFARDNVRESTGF